MLRGTPLATEAGLDKIEAHLIAAARPNFMKVAPVYHALAATD